MSPKLLCILVLSMSLLSGCTVSDALFSVFGDHYTGGGTTWDDKKEHYDRQVEASTVYDSRF